MVNNLIRIMPSSFRLFSFGENLQRRNYRSKDVNIFVALQAYVQFFSPQKQASLSDCCSSIDKQAVYDCTIFFSPISIGISLFSSDCLFQSDKAMHYCFQGFISGSL